MANVMAHRGASKIAPENTMAAFIKAKELGAYGVELDVHILPDKTVVVHHDANLGRCEDVEGSIYNYRYRTIKSFSVGEKFSPEFKNEVVPYFDEVLKYLKENDIFLNCEVKRGTGFSFADEEEVVGLIEKHDMAKSSIISSFDHRLLINIKKKHPNYKIGILYSETYGIDMIEYCVENSIDAVHPHYNLIDKAFVDRAHQNGLEVNVWTVNNIEDIKRMKEYGVDNIISDDVITALKGVNNG
ncbi:MAG: glycerophosphodiester phosphodiesterase family protein [Eubacteriales bacterium]|nr:glycerophosphodiester phosphodiesterase family protein [Eubacteriales bacterium]